MNQETSPVKGEYSKTPKVEFTKVSCLLGVCPLLIRGIPKIDDRSSRISVDSIGGCLFIEPGSNMEMVLETSRGGGSGILRGTRFDIGDDRLFAGGHNPEAWRKELERVLRVRGYQQQVHRARPLGDVNTPDAFLVYAEMWARAGINSGGIRNYRGTPNVSSWTSIVCGNALWRDAFGFRTCNFSGGGTSKRILTVPAAIYEGLKDLLEAGYPPLVPVWWSGLGTSGNPSKLVTPNCSRGDHCGFNGNRSNACFGNVGMEGGLGNLVAKWSMFRRGEATCELTRGKVTLRPPEEFYGLLRSLMGALLRRRRPRLSTQRSSVAQLACQGLPTFAEISKGKGFWCRPLRKVSRRLVNLLNVRGSFPERLYSSLCFSATEAKLGPDERFTGQWETPPRYRFARYFYSPSVRRLMATSVVQQCELNKTEMKEWYRLTDPLTGDYAMCLPRQEREKNLRKLLCVALGDRVASGLIRRELLFGDGSVDPMEVDRVDLIKAIPECLENISMSRCPSASRDSIGSGWAMMWLESLDIPFPPSSPLNEQGETNVTV